MNDHTHRLVITTGEPAGIGPDIVLSAAMNEWPGQLVAIGDTRLLAARAAAIGIEIMLVPHSSGDTAHTTERVVCPRSTCLWRLTAKLGAPTRLMPLT